MQSTNKDQSDNVLGNLETEPSFVKMALKVILSVLENKVLFLGVIILPSLIAVITVLWVIPAKYSAGAIVTLSSGKNSFSNSLGGLLDIPGGSLMSGFIGGMDNGEDVELFLAVLSTKTIHEQVITEFNLAEHYEFDGDYYADLLKSFRENLAVNENDEGMIEIFYSDEDYTLPPKVLNFIILKADSLFRALNKEKITHSKAFFEKRLRMVKEELDSLETEFSQFQMENNIYQVEAQLGATYEILTALKTQQEKLKVEQIFEKKLNGVNTQIYKRLNERLSAVRNRINIIKTKKKDDVVLPLGNMEDVFVFMNYQREYKILVSLYGYIRQRYEELLLQKENNNTSVILVESPWENNKKTSPPRTAIVVVVFLFSIVLALFVVSVLTYIKNEMKVESDIGLLINQVARKLKG